MASQDLQWLLVRTNSSFLVKQKGVGRTFSREPANLTQLHSYKYSGLVNAKSVAVDAPASGKGVVITTRNNKKGPNAIKSSKNTSSIKKGGGRRTAGVVSNIVAKRNYRSDLTKGKHRHSELVFLMCIALEPTVLRHEGSGVQAMPDRIVSRVSLCALLGLRCLHGSLLTRQLLEAVTRMHIPRMTARALADHFCSFASSSCRCPSFCYPPIAARPKAAPCPQDPWHWLSQGRQGPAHHRVDSCTFIPIHCKSPHYCTVSLCIVLR